MTVLHHGWRSSASRRVRLCLEEKGLKYEGHVVDMAKLEHHSPEYLKINPLGVCLPTEAIGRTTQRRFPRSPRGCSGQVEAHCGTVISSST